MPDDAVSRAGADRCAQVIVAGWIDFDPADRDEALRQFTRAVTASRHEPGCVDYAFCADPALPGRVRVFEHWDSDVSLAEHLGRPHVLRLREALSPLRRTGRSLTHSTVTVSRPLDQVPLRPPDRRTT